MRNRKIGMKAAFIVALQSIVMTASAQVDNLEEVRSHYTDANAIYLKRSDQYKIFLENGVLKGTDEVHDQILINKETGINLQQRSVSTNKFIEASNIKAFTMVPKGSKYQNKEVEKIELKDDPDRSSFYDDQKSYSIIYPFVQVGAILDLQYHLNYTEPRFMGSYYFAEYIPGVDNELTISVQKGINIQYKFFNQGDLKIDFTKEEKKNEIIYHWKAANVKALEQYGDAPDFRYYGPHILFYITDYEVEGKKHQVLSSPKDLYAWYYDLQKNVNKTEDKRLKKITDSLVDGTTDELEKVKKIFYWVQDNVSYVAFEDGLGGFIPRDAGMVCSRKFGDCKDMASIIHEMLRMAGITTSYLTWIGSRDIPYKYEDVPTPAVDNHMICTYKDKNGKFIFLDGTGKKAPWDLYTSFIQGKQGLMGISADSFLLVTVPVRDTSVSQTIDSIVIDIKDNIVNGKGRVRLTGYDQLEFQYRTETLNKEDKLDFFKNYFSKGSNKVNFSDVVIPVADRQSPLITYNFTLQDYARKNQDEMYINLNMDNGLSLEQIDETRKVPVSFKHCTIKRLITIMNVPDGYKPDFIPTNAAFGNNVAGFRSSYQVKNNQVIHVSDFYVNTLMLQPEDFAKYNKVLTEQLKANKQAVSLIKK